MAKLELAMRLLAKDDASKSINDVSGSLGRAAAAGSFFGTVAGTIVGKGLGLLGEGARAAVGGIGETISAASDLNESLSKTERVFGPASAAVETFAKSAATNLGLSNQSALEATSTFGNLFTALKIAPDVSADMSQQLVTLAGDLASFNNVDTNTALEALRSGILGEAEPLRKFGVSLSQARIESQALADGIVKPVGNLGKLRDAQTTLAIATEKARVATATNGATSVEAVAANQRVEKAARGVAEAVKGQVPALTASQKAAAAFNIILADTKTAQGDFGRTSDGLANQQRTLAANFANVKAQIGTALLPTITTLAQYINSDVVPAVTGFISGIQDGTGAGGQFADALYSVGHFAKNVGDFLLPIGEFLVAHPDMFASVALGATAFAVALKAQAVWGVIVAKFMPGLAVATAAEGIAAEGAAVGTATLAASLGAAVASASILLPLLVNIRQEGSKFDALIADPNVRKKLGITDLPDKTLAGLTSNTADEADDRKNQHAAVAAGAAATAKATSAARATASAAAAAAVSGYKLPKITSGLSDAIKAGRQAAVDAAKDTVDAIKQQFETAKDKLRDVLRESLNFRLQIAQALTQGSGITDVFASGTDLNGNGAFGGKGGDFQKIKRFLEARLARIKLFSREIRQLIKQGLDPRLVEQIAQAGVDGGERIAAGILAGGTGGIAQINALTAGIAKTSDDVGKVLTSRKFDEQITAIRQQTTTLGHKLDVANAYLARAVTAQKAPLTANSQRASSATLGVA